MGGGAGMAVQAEGTAWVWPLCRTVLASWGSRTEACMPVGKGGWSEVKRKQAGMGLAPDLSESGMFFHLYQEAILG